MPGSRRTRRLRARPRLRAAVASVAALSLLTSLHGPAASAAPPHKATTKQATTPKPKSVSGHNRVADPGVPDLDARYTLTATPAVNWPAPGSAEVTLPAAGTRTLLAKASDLPIQVGPSSAANRAVSLAGKGSAAAEAAAASTPRTVHVDLLGRRDAALVFRLRRTDNAKQGGQVSVRVDYSSFRHAYGGDWSGRLRLLRVPECALTTPGATGCSGVPVATSNDGTGALSADVPANALLAVQAATAGPSGDTAASTISPTATWEAGGASGDFNWNYPMKAPPSLGGPQPDLALGYSSGGVDGRTSGSNSQASWVGAGFEFTPGGSIERRYASCASKTEQKGNNGTKATGDLCWATDNATFSLNGSGGELVRDDATGTWHPKADDGTKVEHLFGAVNPDQGPDGTGTGGKGEYWRITDKSGTKFYFGLNKLPGATSASQYTNSVWTAPVYGNNAQEPCNQAAFANSWCDQAYRWNLDYVVDAHGNTMSLFYDTETNNYGRNATATTVSTYTRAGNLKRIEYGQRDGEVFSTPAVAKVDFTTADRCLGACAAAADYPDTPLDQECTSTTNCDSRFSPTFWTKKRLTKVTTSVWRGSSFAPVSSWSLQQNYLQGDNERAMLWLDSITNTGEVGGSLPTPATTFAAVMKPNRIKGADGTSTLEWPRVKTITYGTGGQLRVEYLDSDCSLPGNVPNPDTNGMRCLPVKWTPAGQAEREDWFNKYVVSRITEADLVSGNEPVVTSVEYLGTPAWHHDDEDGLVEVDRKTWSQWRGYEKVKVIKGLSPGPQTVTVNTYFRGMDGDQLADGTTKVRQVTDSTGAKLPDTNALAGQVREQLMYDGDTITDRAITDPWMSQATSKRQNSWGTTTTSLQVQEQAVRQDVAVDGGRRTSSSTNVYADKADPSGLPVGTLKETSNLNDVANPSDDTCTRYEYTGNATVGLAELPIRKQTVSVGCDKPWTNAQVLGDDKIGYDDPAAAPTKGDRTSEQRLTGFDAAGLPTYQTVSTSTFDAYGRVRSTVDSGNHATRMDYSPATGPVTRTTVTQPNDQVSSTDVDPAWGEPTKVTDPAGRSTVTQRDPLGRVRKIWTPGHSTTGTPTTEYEYRIRPDGAGVVTTKTLAADGGVQTSYELTDGLQRKIQTQEASNDGTGRMISDYQYDSRGLQVKQNGPFYNDAPPGTDYFEPAEEELPAQKLTTYDDQERPLTETFVSALVPQWSTTHVQNGDRETIDPPRGEQATTKIKDVQGRIVELRQYTGDSATGAYDSTKYTYHPAGQLATVTDAAGNVWKFDYDLRGRKIRTEDPDNGVITYTYNDLDQLVSSKDARGVVQSFAYDNVGRKVAAYDSLDQTSAHLTAEWKYDTLKPGSLTSTTRYLNGNAYVNRVLGYGDDGKPTGSQIVIPASEGALAGTYTVGTTYTPDGQPDKTTLPAVGGLPAETVDLDYNAQNQPVTMTGADTYVTGTTYTVYGETSEITMAKDGKIVQQTYDYDESTRRLSRSVFKSEDTKFNDLNYTYDDGGNLTKIQDVGNPGEQTDTQCFGYDAYRRMTQAWTPGDGDCAADPAKDKLGGPAPYWQSWTFDKTGNRKTETRTTAAGTTTSTYTYGATQPHAVTAVATTGAGGDSTDTYSYDQAGNLKTRSLAGGAPERFSWDQDGRLAATTGTKSSSYVYDADGNRLLRKDPSGTTLFLGDTELLLRPDNSLLGTRYYSYGGQTIAVRAGATQLSWVSSDNHNTGTVSVDAVTHAVQKRRTTPYGETRGTAPSAWPGERGFVNGTNDDVTGLVHLGAREYDPSRGRFISVDPVADFNDPQQLNGYAYANNNPASFSDADGRQTVTETVTVMKTVVYMITKRIVEYQKIRIKVVSYIIVFGALSAVAAAFGMVGLSALYTMAVVHYKTIEKKIVRIIHQLATKVIRLIKKIIRYVGPDERANLNNLMKTTAALTDPGKSSQGLWKLVNQLNDFANAANTWAVQAKLATPSGGGGGASGGGGSDFDPKDSNDEGYAKNIIIGGYGAFYGALAGALCLPGGLLAIGCAVAGGVGGAAVGVAVWNYSNTETGFHFDRFLEANGLLLVGSWAANHPAETNVLRAGGQLFQNWQDRAHKGYEEAARNGTLQDRVHG
ncbi:RHS repeat-associated core domain-containing protein [Kribbella sp.]|uniref:RHS repeat domain-containing protein n=1 Tax=Kribbella sp. TaxID=1871183 RepID=UPI002D2F8E11|nr:RHS repeat-associated core domain-containing protein [Kribbella sp.]HZX01402.1 RHS repeat-associated core domain-containing protein [Kribbella sp.]